MKIGEKIKRLRIRNNLTQEELAWRSEVSKGFISQVERELASPSIQTLVDILDGLGTNLREFFTEDTVEQIVFTEEEFFETVNEELGYTLNWVIPNAQKNAMEPILLTLPQAAKSRTVLPHEGEEFGYVLQGSVLLHVGDTVQKVQRGETFYLDGSRLHYLENTNKKTAQVLWISTPPVF